MRSHLLEKFQEEYTRLNDNQRKAVDTIEGPVMVIAGPGTGKTQILAARIGKILLETDAYPENILCLTYTDAGALAMRRRLVHFIGADAYKVNIYTFHAFCNNVIQDNLSLFDKHSLDPVSELESIQLFKELVDSFPKNHPLKRYRGDVYYEIKNLRSLFSSMKREGWAPAFLDDCITRYVESLPLRDEYIYKKATGNHKKGDVKTDKLEDEKERMEKLRSAIHEFERYQQILARRNRYDFDDMINWVIKAFETNPSLLSGYQERYQYILVDEYQDTSGTQNRIVQLLISFWDKPNVFVVGDDDQSIFRFQGANIENMQEFADNYKRDLLTVVLTNNYRSTQPILDISKTLIEGNEERLVKKIEGLTKELISSNEKIKHLDHAPILREYASVKEEMAGIALEIASLLEQDVPPGKIAVIFKENKYGTELSGYFRLKEIPVYTKRSINILENPFAIKLMKILRYLDSEHDVSYSGDALLFEIMHYDFFKIPPIEIAKLANEVSSSDYKNPTYLRKLLYEKAHAKPKDLFDNGPDNRLANVSDCLEKLIADVPNVALQQLFENIVINCGVLSYIMKDAQKLFLMQILTGLFDFIKEETSRDPNLSLKELVKIINLMEKEEIRLPIVQVSGTDKGVNLLTVHGSKGLEFEYVFFVGTDAGLWEKKKAPSRGYKLPDTIFGPDSRGHTSMEELRRQFFVALTRAEKNLVISWAKFRNDGKEQEPSVFIAEIQEQHDLPVERVTVPAESLLEFDILRFSPQVPEIDKAEESLITPLVEKFVMNVTALNNYLRCPLAFYYNNLIRVPSGKNENTEFGSAIHHSLELLFRKMMAIKELEGKAAFPPKAEVLGNFKWYLDRHRGSFTPDAYARRLEYGEEVLSNYYDTYINSWNKVVLVELNIRGVVVNGVPLKGKLDKLEFNGKDVNIVDYKTGAHEYSIGRLRPPGEKEPNGGDYWRQAVFYKLLVDNYPSKDWKAVSTEFDFIEPDKKKKYHKEKVTVTPADIETVKQQLTEVWAKIQAHDFYTGCGKEDCSWCNFIKDNNLAVALHEPQEEEV